MRKLVAIGTHDLDVVEGPFQYDAQPRDEVSFVPLTEEDKEWTGKALLDHYNTDPGCKHLKPYTKLIYDCPNYPVISDAKGRVMSMPPIINGAHSRIQKGKTTNVFIECTATDLTKVSGEGGAKIATTTATTTTTNNNNNNNTITTPIPPSLPPLGSHCA